MSIQQDTTTEAVTQALGNVPPVAEESTAEDLVAAISEAQNTINGDKGLLDAVLSRLHEQSGRDPEDWNALVDGIIVRDVTTPILDKASNDPAVRKTLREAVSMSEADLEVTAGDLAKKAGMGDTKKAADTLKRIVIGLRKEIAEAEKVEKDRREAAKSNAVEEDKMSQATSKVTQPPLPPDYILTDFGIVRQAEEDEHSNSFVAAWPPPLPKALARDENSTGWGMLMELKDPDGHAHEVLLPTSDLVAKDKLSALFGDSGFSMSPSPKTTA